MVFITFVIKLFLLILLQVKSMLGMSQDSIQNLGALINVFRLWYGTYATAKSFFNMLTV